MELNQIVVITVCKNHELFLQKSLPSIVNQSRLPNHLIVIDESSGIFNLESVISNKISCEIKFNIIKNSRTQGYSGTWNSGIVFVMNNYNRFKNIFIAILNYEDEWNVNHLSKCLEHAQNSDVIISNWGYRSGSEISNETVPKSLNFDEILIFNFNFCTSNIFIRLSSLLECGLFDENLTDFHQIDLYMRLIDINARISCIKDHTINCGLDPNNKFPSQKPEGNLLFWKKYQKRMNKKQKSIFLERNPKFLNTTFNEDFYESITSMDLPKNIEPFHLVVAVISDDAQQLKLLLQTLHDLKNESFLLDLDVLVMSNCNDEKYLLDLAKKMVKQGLNCHFIDQNRQTQDISRGVFGKFFQKKEGKLGIGKARTVLQRYLHQFLKDIPDAIAWILDDDMQLDDRSKFYLPWLPEFRKRKIDILLGSFEQLSPNPPLNGIRVQLVDFVNNLLWLDNLNSQDELPNYSKENYDIRLKYPDYYYDLSRLHTAHLETIYWLTPSYKGETVENARKRLIDNAIYLFSGEQITRSLIVDLPKNPIQEARESVNRGGNTFILNHSALLAPNTIVELSGKEARRSDMVWAIINRYYYHLNIKQVRFPVIHKRNVSLKSEPEFNIEKTISEIQGSAIYAALKEILQGYSYHNLDFDDEEIAIICENAQKYLEQRMSALNLSYFRSRGICKFLKKYDQKGELKEFIEKISYWYSEDSYKRIKLGIQNLSTNRIYEFIKSIKPQIESYASSNLTYNLNNWCDLSTPIGNFRMYDTGDEEIKLVSYGDIFKLSSSPLIRIHSSCAASELFKSSDCDCADQLDQAMSKIASKKEGIIFHILQEGRGQGLSNKIKAVSLMQKQNLDTVQAFEALNLEQDVRNYQKVVNILFFLNIQSVRLITNNPRKKIFLEKSGISVECISTKPKIRKENKDYLYSKRDKLNHSLKLE